MGLFNNKPPEGGNNAPPAGTNNQPPEGGSNAPPADNNKPPEGPVTVYRSQCVEACTFQGRYRKEGDIVELGEKHDKLPHFEPVI
jgi:hypothetical protein